MKAQVRRNVGLTTPFVVIGDESGNVYDPYLPGYVRVRQLYANGYGPSFPVLGPAGTSIVLQPGTRVKLVNTSDNKVKIADYDITGGTIDGTNLLAPNTPTLPSGSFVGQQSIVTALVAPQAIPDLTVIIKAWPVILGGIYYEFPGTNSLDLSASVPSAGNNLYVVVFIDNDFASTRVTASTARSIADLPLAAADIQECLNAAPVTSTPLAAIRLYGGQTQILNSDIKQDLRQMINGTGAAGSVSGPATTTDRAIASWNGTTGTVLRDNPNTNVDSSGNLQANAWRLPTATTLTISSNAVTITQGYHLIESSSGTTDNLATVNGGVDRQIVILQADADDTITLKNGTGNIFLNSGADQAISGKQTIALFLHGGNWTDIDFGSGSGITQLTGDVTAGPGSGSQAATLANSGVSAGSYKDADVTFDAKGRATAASDGSYHTVQDNGTDKTRRAKLNIIAGTNITTTIADNSGSNRTDVTINSSGGSGTGYILIQEQQTQNTASGTFSSGAWRTRVLNTIVTDTTGAVTLSSNQFTLPAGTYRIRARAPAMGVDRHQGRLQNITDSVTTIIGSSEVSQSTFFNDVDTIIEGRFTISGSKTFEIQHQCQTTNVTNGFGLTANFTTEIYTSVELVKE